MIKVVLVLLGLLCLIGTSSAMGSLNFNLSWNVIGGGGGFLSSPSYSMGSTVGQITGLSTSTSYKLQSGFRVTGTAIPDKIGVFRNSTHLFFLDYNGNGTWDGAVVDRQYNFGISGDLPVSGDWNSDGRSEIGVFRNSTKMFYLDYNANGVWNGSVVDRQYNFSSISGDLPISGDWNNDGISEIGVFRNSTKRFLLDFNGNGVWNGASVDRSYNFGITGDLPISGKW